MSAAAARAGCRAEEARGEERAVRDAHGEVADVRVDERGVA